MAQRTIVQLTDDLDGKPIPDGKGETIRFGLDRTDYEIDLTDKNAKALRDTVSKYVAAARRTGSGAPAAPAPAVAPVDGVVPVGAGARRPVITTPRRSGSGLSRTGSRSAKRGRVPAALIAKFQEANA